MTTNHQHPAHEPTGDFRLDTLLRCRHETAVLLYQHLSHGHLPEAIGLLTGLWNLEEAIGRRCPTTAHVHLRDWEAVEADLLHEPGDPRYLPTCPLCQLDWLTGTYHR